jgi:hypothetical protein
MKYFLWLFALTLPAFGQGVPVLQNPTTTQTVAQPTGTALNVNGMLNAEYINGTAQADQFPGADMCLKIYNAIYAVLHQAPTPAIDIDATHFSGNQPCSVNPLTAVPSGWAGHLSLRLGHVKILSAVSWQVDTRTLKILTLTGISPSVTQLVYTGTSSVNAVLYVNPAGGDCANMKIENLYLLGNGYPPSTAYAGTGLFVLNCIRSEFNNIWAWGTQSFGIYVQGGVSDTLRAPRVSMWDANEVLFNDAGAPTMAGIQLDATTTAGTISDAAVEGIPGTGIVCASAGNMVFLAGTSEQNGQGVYIGPNCSDITLIGMDLEANVDANNIKIDLHDLGNNTTLINLFAPNRVLNPNSTGSNSTGICQGSACWLSGNAAPTGPCSAGSLFTRTDTGNLYVCQYNAWVLK